MRSVSMPYGISRSHAVLAAAGAAATLVVSTTASASLPAQVIATRFNLNTGAASQVPGLPQSQIDAAAEAGATITWNNPQFSSPGLSTNPVIDNAGNVAFYGQMGAVTGAPPTLAPIISNANQNAVFYSSAASNYAFNNISIIARDGSATGNPQGGPTPSNPNNWVLNSATGTNGINAGVGMSSSGQILITSQLNGPGAVANSNNTAFFTGGSNSLAQAAIRGQVAPGTTNAVFNTQLNFSASNNSVNPSGQVPFASALTGGDTVTSGAGQNDSGMWVASPSGASMVMRRGQAVPDSSGAVYGAMTTNPGNNRINASGAVVFSNTLSTTVGTATAANDSGLFTNVGGSVAVVAREGSVIGGSSSLAGESYVASGTHFNMSTQSLNNSGQILYNARLANSANISASNNEALMIWSNGSATPLFQTGTSAVPDVAGATFSGLGFGNTQARLNNNGSVVFAGQMTGGSVTTADDQGLWFGNAGSISSAALIAREGMTAPGAAPGVTFGNGFFGVIMNNADMVIFQNQLSDGKNGWFAWGEDFGLIDIAIAGSTNILGANYPLGQIGFNSTSNGDGGVMSFNDNGLFTFIATSSGAGSPFGNNGAIVVMQIPTPASGALAGLGLLAAASRRRRR